MTTDGEDVRTVLSDLGGTPDGVTVDRARNHLYWTNMGDDFGKADGWIERSDFDGKNRVVIVPKGRTFTPKQIEYDPVTDRLYWCDREGMCVMRATREGDDVSVLVRTGSSDADRADQRRHCVGIAIDPQDGFVYWTQKGPTNGGVGRLLRAPLAHHQGADPSSREDIEVLLDGLPEPIDLLLDAPMRTLYWTDRGRPPEGNTLNSATVGPAGCFHRRVLIRDLKQGIGVCANSDRSALFVTDLVPGHVRRLDLAATTEARTILTGSPMTGIVCA